MHRAKLSTNYFYYERNTIQMNNTKE